MARNLEKDLLPVLFQAKMQLQSMQFEQLLVEQTTNSLCWIWEPCYGSQFCLTNCYAWGCSATQQFRRIFRMGKMSLWDRGWISVAVPECGKGLWQSKRPGSLSFRHCYKLRMRNELKWFLSCIFRLNCTYMTYDTWFMIYDTGCMIGGKYVYVYIETQIAARSKKPWMFPTVRQRLPRHRWSPWGWRLAKQRPSQRKGCLGECSQKEGFDLE